MEKEGEKASVEKEYMSEEEISEEKETKYPELVIGNTHKKKASSDQNCHHWKIYVHTVDPTLKLESFVNKVVFNLHPTFSPQKISFSKGPFEISRIGWGTFHVGVSVHWKDGKKSEYKHHLDFSKDKTEDVYKVE